MRVLRWLLLPILILVVGCDAAAIVYFSGKKGGGGGDSGALAASGSAAPVFEVWVASIPTVAAGDGEGAALEAANGNPSSPTWTRVGNASVTTEFGPLANPSSYNAILVQASSDQNYLLDSIEILGSQDQVQEYASGKTWSSRVDFPDRMLGAPDGSPAVTNAAGDSRAFIFTRYSGPIQRFRINGQGVGRPPAPGDTLGSGSISSPGDESPGGAAANPGGGLINVPINLGGSIFLARFDSNGGPVDEVQVASGVTASEGSESVAVGPDGNLYVASTVADGQVQVRQFGPTLNAGWSVTFSSGMGGDRVDSNGIAIDGDGYIVVSGGRNGLLNGVTHWMARLSASGSVLWEQNPNDDPSGPTYWRGVTTGPGGQIFSAGDLNPSLLGGGPNEVRTARFSAGGVAQWSQEYAEPGSSSNLGRAVALEPSGSVIVGGYLGTSNQGRNGVLLRYSSSGTVSSVLVHDGPASGDDEILDVEADSDGSVFAAGYETVAGQGENLWVRKYAPNGTTAWTRTYDGGYGNDRAVSLTLTGSRVVVAGYRTNSSGQKKFMLRVYAK